MKESLYILPVTIKESPKSRQKIPRRIRLTLGKFHHLLQVNLQIRIGTAEFAWFQDLRKSLQNRGGTGRIFSLPHPSFDGSGQIRNLPRSTTGPDIVRP